MPTVRGTQERVDRGISTLRRRGVIRILRSAEFPERGDYLKVLEITLLGATILGTVGFIIYLIMSTLIGP